VGSLLVFLHPVDVSSVADISQAHAASIFRVKVGRVSKFSNWSNSPKMREGCLLVRGAAYRENQVLICSIGELCVRKAEFAARSTV
jgi:hypothetical protein